MRCDRCRTTRLEHFRPSLCAVVYGEDHDAATIDAVGCDKRRIRNDQFPSARNPARSAQHGEGGKLLNADDNLHCDPGSNLFAVCECDEIMSLVLLPKRLLGPFDHARARLALLRR